MEYLIVGALAGFLVWTAAVAGVAWYARGQAAEADVRLLEYALEAKEIEIDQLHDVVESMEKGEKLTVDHLRRRAQAARLADPRARRRALYAGLPDDAGGGADGASAPAHEQAEGSDPGADPA